MTRRPALAALALALVLALPASASAHTIKGLVHDARDVIVRQAPGTHAAIAADGVHLELRRERVARPPLAWAVGAAAAN